MLQILPVSLILILSCFRIATSQDDSSEEKSDVPIIRQINKVNDDGTYTYGYEAADGSFKIETRDVLGNVKGMFGFIDDSGDLKRVSYTANNATGYRNSVIHPPVPTTVRSSELGRRPVLILKNTVTSSVPTKGPVIQHIPKKPTKEEDETTSTEFTNGRSYLPVRNDSSEERTEEPTRPPALNPLRKVLVSKRPIEDKENRGKGGNSLRRQLSRGLDLRGEMSHIYSGGDSRFATGIPPHLSALMSELRPIQIIRAAPPETVGYQTVDAESASQEINEVPTTTTELPYGTRRPYNSAGYISSRFRRPVPMPEDTQYLQEITPQYRQHNALPFAPRGFQGTQGIQPVTPVNSHLPLPMPSAEYQTHPHYYDQGGVMVPPTLRDELMAIIYNYLQVRLNSLTPQSPYYGARHPYSPSPYYNPNLFVPASPAYPYTHAGYSQPPYGHPYLPLNGYYPPYANPHAVYPVSTQTPYSGPNVQFARPEQQRRVIPIARVQNVRATSHADDADLLQMLLTSPTRIPVVNQLKYTPTTERLVSTKTGQPIRNLQIITETTEPSRSGTTEVTEKK